MSGSVSCSICSENYRNSDEIYTTSCGHVYHFRCMQQWQSRSTSCPQCRTHNPTSHKIYLTFDETDEQEKAGVLKVQLDKSVLLISELQLKVDESERSFLALHGQYMESEEKIRQRSETIEYQEIQNASRVRENAEKRRENAELKQKLELHLSPEQELVLRDEVASLKLSLQKTSLQLEKEVDSATVLAERAAVLAETIAKYERSVADAKEQLAQMSQELEKEAQRSAKLAEERAKLAEKLKQQNDAVKQYQTVERALQVKIEFLTRDIEEKQREIENLKDAASQLSAKGCVAAGEGAQTATADADKLGRLECKLKELNALLVKEKMASSDWLINKIELEQRLERSEEKTAELEESSRRTEEMLKIKIEDLTTENERRAKELTDRDAECQQLMEKMRKMVSAETEVLLRERIKTLNSKLDEAWTEVAAKLKLSTSLAVEKMQIEAELERSKRAFQELQAQHDLNFRELRTKTDILRTQNELLGKQTAAKPEQHFSMANNMRSLIASSENAKMMGFPNGGDRFAGGASLLSCRTYDGRADRYGSSVESINSLISSLPDHSTADECDTRSVSIRDIPNSYMDGPLHELVLKFAIILGVLCTADDIEEVHTLGRPFALRNGAQKDNRHTVVVKFKRLDLKIKFLANKDKLKPHGIFMSEFLDREIYRLYQCARPLMAFGFHVYCRNNKVFVKNNALSAPMRISNKEDVDRLMEAGKRDKLKKNVKPGNPKAAKNTVVSSPKVAEKCDDQFYALSD